MTYQASLSAAPGFAGPLYAQVANYLRERITAAEWSSSVPMPNEAVLAKDIGVSVGTMRKALELLEGERLIQRRQGRGTFVIEASDQSDVERFVTLVADGRKLKGEVTALTSDASTADAEAANRLAIRIGDPVARFELAWRASHGVRVFERVVVAQARFPEIERTAALPSPFLFPIYRRVYKTIVHAITERTDCVLPDLAMIEALRVEPSRPLLRVERSARTRTGQVVEWSVRTMHLGTARYAASVE
ncbi:MAG: GntR family transcriptional regulator [Hyphomicrobium sp.]|nr:GntR family transcriptional regulator [Hyphomicrobium sp.]